MNADHLMTRDCPDCGSVGQVPETFVPLWVPVEERDVVRMIKCLRCGASGRVENDAMQLFMDEYSRQLAGLPHHAQAAVLAMPGGLQARQLVAHVLAIMEERGIEAA